MEHLSDIEIAQQCKMQPIVDIARAAGVDEKYLELYGNYKAKVNYSLLKESKRGDGKLMPGRLDTAVCSNGAWQKIIVGC